MSVVAKNYSHYPVMLNEVISSLNIKKNGIYVDGTYGTGNYSNAILNAGASHLIAIDQDPAAEKTSINTKKKYGSTFSFIGGNFKNLKDILENMSISHVDGIVVDLGVSSPQLDQAERGFSFNKNGPLDMRMSQEGKSAKDIINTMPEKDLADIFWKYGEEKKSYKIAHSIEKARNTEKITSTIQLANIIKNTFSARELSTMKIHPATRCFQAIRIYVNNELDSLESLLSQSVDLLNDQGRLVVVTFHSLEDRIVKKFIKKQSGNEPSTMPKDLQKNIITLKEISRKPILASREELSENPRSRSAKLRVAQRIINKKNLQRKI